MACAASGLQEYIVYSFGYASRRWHVVSSLACLHASLLPVPNRKGKCSVFYSALPGVSARCHSRHHLGGVVA